MHILFVSYRWTRALTHTHTDTKWKMECMQLMAIYPQTQRATTQNAASIPQYAAGPPTVTVTRPLVRLVHTNTVSSEVQWNALIWNRLMFDRVKAVFGIHIHRVANVHRTLQMKAARNKKNSREKTRNSSTRQPEHLTQLCSFHLNAVAHDLHRISKHSNDYSTDKTNNKIECLFALCSNKNIVPTFRVVVFLCSTHQFTWLVALLRASGSIELCAFSLCSSSFVLMWCCQWTTTFCRDDQYHMFVHGSWYIAHSQLFIVSTWMHRRLI